jgi:hypothetical protein
MYLVLLAVGLAMLALASWLAVAIATSL